MQKFFVLLVLIISVFFVASMSEAALVTYNGVDNPVPVNITAPFLGTINTSAGYAKINVDTLNYFAFCVDPSYATYTPTEYTVLSATTMENKYKAAAWVLDQALNGVFTDKAAAQIAVWELVFDWGNSVNLTANSFILNSPGDPLKATATGYALSALSAYGTWTGANNYSVAVKPDPGYYGVSPQDFVFAFETQTVNPPVPIPPTAYLLGAGLLGLVGLRRKFKK